MRINKKIELYQHYKKLENKLINKNIINLLLRGISIFIWFIMLCMGTATVPALKRTNWFNAESFIKELCVWDSIDASQYRGNFSHTYYFTIVRNLSLDFDERKRKTIKAYCSETVFGEKTMYEYFEEQYSTSIEIDTTLYSKPILLWVNEKTNYAEYVYKESPDKIDFTTEKILFAIFLLSFPFYYFFIIVLWKKWKKRKIKLQREIIKAKHQWQNYTE
ncbi:MAG: hypothetical protein Q4B43_11010 [Bacteroidota bacterium]|nr:hypothetical protein [Bacteroidota bacterium]